MTRTLVVTCPVPCDDLAKLEGLHDSGAIDDEEFARLKQNLAPG